jgi:PhnB protein
VGVQLNPYLAFKGKAREAMEFYKGVFGGNLHMQTFKDFGAPVEAGEADNIMHAALEGENGVTFFASDTPSHMDYRPGTHMSMSLSGNSDAELRRYWDGLSQGAQIQQPLEKAPWGDTFGMLTDKFGIAWLVNISPS